MVAASSDSDSPVSRTRKPGDNHLRDGVRRTMGFWRPPCGQQVGPLFPQARTLSSNMWPHKRHRHEILPQALWVVPGTRSLTRAVCVCSEGETEQQPEWWPDVSAMQPSGHTRHRTQSHARCVFQSGHSALWWWRSTLAVE